jgi:hypothetical protein
MKIENQLKYHRCLIAIQRPHVICDHTDNVIQGYGVHGIDVRGGMREYSAAVVIIVVINPIITITVLSRKKSIRSNAMLRYQSSNNQWKMVRLN